MRPGEHAASFAHEETDWWHVSMAEIDAAVLRRFRAPPGPLLDAGCGTGGWLARLSADDGRPRFGFDLSPDALRFGRSRGLRRLFAGSLDRIPARAGTFAVVACRHVIEHVEDDAAVVAEAARVAAPGGLVLVTAPAIPWLWTSHDDANEHRRRYRKRDLVALVERAGLEILLARRVNVLPTVLAIALMLKERLRPPREARRVFVARPLNALLRAYMRLEGIVFPRLPAPVGLSLVVVGRRR